LSAAKHLKRWKEIYETAHPETKARVTGAVAMNKKCAREFFRRILRRRHSRKTGIMDRHVRRSIRRAEDVDEKVRDPHAARAGM
jgi:hypothetical protein